MHKREAIITEDGSSSLYIEEWDESYHSKHGAIAEAEHIFIKMGLELFKNKENISILEIGFGTGLNTLISLSEKPIKQYIKYFGVEKYPLNSNELKALNYSSELNVSERLFEKIHSSNWNELSTITDSFILNKIKCDFAEIELPNESIDLIYFDAFSPRFQPELWHENIFKLMYETLKQGGVLVTYCAKGEVRRTMQKLGFKMERLPGPPGKREMLRATKDY